jgi:hypothetical protein
MEPKTNFKVARVAVARAGHSLFLADPRVLADPGVTLTLFLGFAREKNEKLLSGEKESGSQAASSALESDQADLVEILGTCALAGNDPNARITRVIYHRSPK